MATTKQRINISLSKSTVQALRLLAKHDQEPIATKASALVEFALEIEEDRVLVEIAEKRDTKGVRWIKDSDKLWK
jgi:hypothetical protein